MSKQQANYQKRFAVMHNPAVKAEIAALDPVRDCQRIVQLLVQYEFAWDITRSLEIALFYTYGSASVSRLLDRTGEFAKHGQKRYDDTRLLIAHFMDSGWDGPVGSAALARMNKKPLPPLSLSHSNVIVVLCSSEANNNSKSRLVGGW